jgi:hypothetical protein
MYLQCKIDFIIRKIKNEFIFTEPNSKGNNLSRAKLKINVLFLLLWLSRVLYLTLKKAISFLNKNICLDGLCILFELKHTHKKPTRLISGASGQTSVKKLSHFTTRLVALSLSLPCKNAICIFLDGFQCAM